MSTTRSLRNRSSRYSSPATYAEKDVSAKQTDSQQTRNGHRTSLDKWVEPPVRNAVPSFEDTKGLERLGVLEHMAPLGVPPSQKLLQKLKVNFARSSPRVTPLQLDETETPLVEPIRPDIASPIDTELLLEPVEEPLALSPPRGRPAKKDADEMRQAYDPTTPSPVKSSFQQNLISPKPQSIQDYIRQDRMKNSLRRAIEEAQRESDLRLVPGLESLLEDAKSKASLWSVIDAIASKSPTDSQFRVFKRYIKRGMKQYQQDSTFSFSSLQRSRSTLKSQNIGSPGALSTSSQHNRTSSNQMSDLSPHASPSQYKIINGGSTDEATYDRPRSISPRIAQYHSTMLTTQPFSSPTEKRSRSVSTSSSLSSAKSLPDDFPRPSPDDPDARFRERKPVRSSGQRQATSRVAVGSRTRSTANNPSDPAQSHPTLPTTIRFINRKLQRPRQKEDTPVNSEKLEAKRTEFARDSLQDYNDIPRSESHERSLTVGLPIVEGSVDNHPRPPVVHPHPLQPATATLLMSPSHQPRPDAVLVNGTARKRTYDEFEREEIDASSPVSSSSAPLFPPPPQVASNAARGSTPRATRLQPPNKARKSARVMVSPNKPKNGGVTAGISRAGAGRENVIGNGAESGLEDNDEFCASCGGEGTLLCCDGCTNSFHHACLEPPMDPDQEVDGEWFCPQCIARRNKQPVQLSGLLGQVIRRVENTIPKAFSLPFEIRDYFEGVRTGEEGEYEEISLPRTQNNAQKMNRAGFFEQPNYKELRDSKGNFIICYGCKKTSNGRDIIPCDFCPAKWHTDCIDPPMAVPPRRAGGDKPNGYWRCPLHIEQDLMNLSRQAELGLEDVPREPRLRKPKKAIPIDVDMSRGFCNNGIIEVELMKEEKPNIKEVALDRGIYRLPERGIRLDFIDRVKKSWYEDHMLSRQAAQEPIFRKRLYRPSHPVLHHPAAYTIFRRKESDLSQGVTALAIAETAKANAKLRQKSFKEQSAIMSLMGLANHNQVLEEMAADPLSNLINQLISDAPETAEAEIIRSERDNLLRLQSLVNKRLAIIGDRGVPGEVNGVQEETFNGDKRDPSSINGHITSVPDESSDQINGDNEGDGDDEGGSAAEGDMDLS